MDRMGSGRPTRSAVALILLVVLTAGGGTCASEPPGVGVSQIPTANLAHWTAMLGSDQFVRRQDATRQLVSAGEQALPHLARAVYNEDVEVRYRAVYILQHAAQAAEPHNREPARGILKQLAAAEEPSVAQIAARALRDIANQAMIGLQQKGARLKWQDNHVESVHLMRGRVTNDDLRCLRELSELKELDLRFTTTITNPGLEHIAHLTTLEVLNLQATRVTDAGLSQLARLQNLRSLSLERTAVTDAGLKYLKPLRHLDILYLGGSRVKGPGLRDLHGLPITYLSFQNSPVDDSVVDYIAPMRQLKTLGLDETAVTDACLPKLVELENLEVLWLKGTAVTDACIPCLIRLEHLNTLHIEQTNLSAEGLTKLERSLRNVKVSGSVQRRRSIQKPSNERARL